MKFLTKPISMFMASLFGFAILYAALRLFMPIGVLITLLNGLFAGSLAAVGVAYGPLFIHAVTGRKPYDSVRQMTVGFTLLWCAMSVAVLNSVYINATGLFYPTTELSLFARYAAIVAAAIQVYAPDFGLGLFHGRDRRVFATSTLLGLIVAGVIILMQSAPLE